MSNRARIIWSNPADRDIDAIWGYLVERNPVAAEQMQDIILKAVDRLAEFPYSGRPGRLAGTRELIIPRYSYIVVYGVIDIIEPTEVVIYRLFHGSQNWQKTLEDIDNLEG